MSKNKRKAASTVARRQDALHAPIVVPDDHDHDGDGSVVLALTIALGTKPNAFPCEPRTDLPPMSSSQPSDVCLSDLQPASMMVVASGSTSLDEVWVENFFVDSDEEILEEDQLDFNFSDEECDDSPKSPTLLPVENVSSPPPSGGRVPDTTTATLTIHDSGWLVYKFKIEEDKLTVLRGGPYLVYGRPLILRPMTNFFDFSSEEMSRVPVWVKFPNLPLCCLSPVCLSKIASVLRKPIQSLVLVEIDLLGELRHSIEVSLLEGPTLHQKVVYETLPKFCNFCRVLGHSRLLCPKTATNTNKGPSSQPQAQAMQADKGSIFSRLGP
uniref:DUF4283 domain-containing protein n=1 Tax=Populus trichocarpa TaxID=3694 RepID=A0A2K1XY33_POPTR